MHLLTTITVLIMKDAQLQSPLVAATLSSDVKEKTSVSFETLLLKIPFQTQFSLQTMRLISFITQTVHGKSNGHSVSCQTVSL